MQQHNEEYFRQTHRQINSLWLPPCNSQHKVNSEGRYEVTEEVVDRIEEGRSWWWPIWPSKQLIKWIVSEIWSNYTICNNNNHQIISGQLLCNQACHMSTKIAIFLPYHNLTTINNKVFMTNAECHGLM